jgi:phosphoribosylformylglycinamidine cyclo-ligase
MVPTKLYVLSVLALHRAGLLKAAAHITGGGLPGNLPRALPAGTVARLDASRWDVPPVFRWLAQAGGITPEEMLRVFNCGIGMALIVAAADEAAARAILEAEGERVFTIGRVEAGDGPPTAEVAVPAGWPV